MGTARQPINDPKLYERDYYAWTGAMSERLKRKDPSGLDWENLAEEIESLGRSIKRELKSDLRVLIMHVLKWKTQPERRSGSWKSTINEHRRRLNDLIEESPSLQHQIDDVIDRAYADAVSDAIEEMGLLQNPFPTRCPFTIAQLRDVRFWPG